MDSKNRYFRNRVLKWFDSNKRSFPWRQTNNPYRTLLAEILLQQTDSGKARDSYLSLIRRFPRINLLARATKAEILRYVAPIGLVYRATRLSRIARYLTKNFGGQIPSTKKALMLLPGVGPYIAHSVLVSAFGNRLAVVDTNVLRVLDRFFGIRSMRPRPRTDPAIWEAAQKLLPREASKCREWNYALLDFAALVCRWARPHCELCPCRRRCSYFALSKGK